MLSTPTPSWGMLPCVVDGGSRFCVFFFLLSVTFWWENCSFLDLRCIFEKQGLDSVMTMIKICCALHLSSENLSILNEFSVCLCEAGIISLILQTSR